VTLHAKEKHKSNSKVNLYRASEQCAHFPNKKAARHMCRTSGTDEKTDGKRNGSKAVEQLQS
jgi:hypothetical protein